jgi:hypothetical protein
MTAAPQFQAWIDKAKETDIDRIVRARNVKLATRQNLPGHAHSAAAQTDSLFTLESRFSIAAAVERRAAA